MLITLLFLLTPVIPAFQFSMVTEAQEEKFREEFHLPINGDFNLESLLDSNSLNFESLVSFLKTLFKTGVSGKLHDKLSSDGDDGGDVQQQALVFLGLLFYGLLFWILFKIILYVFLDVGSFFGLIVNHIKSKFVNFFTFILSIIVGTFNFIGSILGGTFNLIVTVILSILAVGVGAVKLLINLVVFILFGIVKLVGLAWNTIGAIIGLFLDIILLIFGAIFPSVNGA
jgi:hypothetical protein